MTFSTNTVYRKSYRDFSTERPRSDKTKVGPFRVRGETCVKREKKRGWENFLRSTHSCRPQTCVSIVVDIYVSPLRVHLGYEVLRGVVHRCADGRGGSTTDAEGRLLHLDLGLRPRTPYTLRPVPHKIKTFHKGNDESPLYSSLL